MKHSTLVILVVIFAIMALALSKNTKNTRTKKTAHKLKKTKELDATGQGEPGPEEGSEDQAKLANDALKDIAQFLIDPTKKSTDCKKMAKFRKINALGGKNLRMGEHHFTEVGMKTIQIFNIMYGESYKKEQDAIWEGFKAAKGDASPNGITKSQLANGMTQFQWNMEVSPTQLADQKIAEFAVAKPDALNKHEMIYAAMKAQESVDIVSTCENCFSETRKGIAGFYNYLDCKKKGWISAETLWETLENVKHEEVEEFETTCVNEFVLVANKSDERGKLRRNDFISGVMRGFYELVTMNEPTE